MVKKSMSALISMALLLLFTIASGGLLVVWMIDYTKTTTDAADSGTLGTGGVISCSNQILGITGVYLIQDSTSTTQFSDQTSTKTFSSAAGGSYTAYVRIPKNASVVSTSLTLTGQAFE